MTLRVVAFVPDLMDRGRFGSGASPPQFLASLAELAATSADVVLVDLSRPGVIDAVAGLAARVIGFAPHVDDDTLARAAAVGVEAHPRSVFFRRLPEWLAQER